MFFIFIKKEQNFEVRSIFLQILLSMFWSFKIGIDLSSFVIFRSNVSGEKLESFFRRL
jgi:hypothetical protein